MEPNAIGAWLRQSTTGQGATVLLGTLLAYSQGAMTLQQAIPAIVGGSVLVIWPQNQALAAAAKTTAADLEPLFLAYRTGLTHGAAAATTATPTAPVAPATAGVQPNA